MNNKYLQIIVLVVLAILVLFVIPWKHQPVKVTDFQSCERAGGQILQSEPAQCLASDGKIFTEDTNPAPEVVLDTPQYGDLVSSPLKVSGKARGSWFFEGSMPMTLKDDQGKILAQTPAHADGDWMTTNYVPFSATLTFDPGTAQSGVLIISKDNPSGDPANASSVAIPVRFK